MIENQDVPPSERLMILKEVAEEARAYKMGGEDKIRVAVNMSDMVCCIGSIRTDTSSLRRTQITLILSYALLLRFRR